MDPRLTPFKFRVKHTRRVNVVANALSHMFEGQCSENSEGFCARMLGSLPLVYSDLQEHQRGDAFCEGLREAVENKDKRGYNIHNHNGLRCYSSKKDRRRRWVVPSLKNKLQYKGCSIKDRTF
jgi:hypothetical protein